MEDLEKLAKLTRYFILTSTTKAGSGHPTSSLSATDLMVTLLFGGYFRADLKNQNFPNNDRLIFSKGHASPLFYSLYAAADAIKMEDLDTLRKFGSPLEGHPTMEFPYTEAATGSLGQGLSVGVGLSLNAKYLDKLPYVTFVLLGDSEMAEGSVWEAMQIAYFYKLDNLVAILDVNRLGQSRETMYGHNVKSYQEKVSSFGWKTIVINGHNLKEIKDAYEKALKVSSRGRLASGQKGKPTMIIAKTLKGKGVSFLEDKEGWHGKALSEEDLEKALKELGNVDLNLKGEVGKSQNVTLNVVKGINPELYSSPAAQNDKVKARNDNIDYPKDKPVATRKAYGNALVRIFPSFPNMVVMDGEVSNSTFSETFKKAYPERFFEMFIAEGNMVGAAIGLSKRGKIPFISTFAAFFSRAFDQIRMSQYSNSNIKFVGSHTGVSIGEDGASQMGLEDIAMFRTLRDSVVLYPSDAPSTERLVEEAAKHFGNVYIRTTRMDTPIIYSQDEEFKIGGSKIHKVKSQNPKGKNKVGIVAAGITLHEALKAQEELTKEGIGVVVIDLYSIKPLDKETLEKVATETKAIIIVEDHYPEGGIGEAVAAALADNFVKIYSLAVRKIPRSGKPDELLEYEEISSSAIIKKVKEILK